MNATETLTTPTAEPTPEQAEPRGFIGAITHVRLNENNTGTEYTPAVQFECGFHIPDRQPKSYFDRFNDEAVAFARETVDAIAERVKADPDVTRAAAELDRLTASHDETARQIESLERTIKDSESDVRKLLRAGSDATEAEQRVESARADLARLTKRRAYLQPLIPEAQKSLATTTEAVRKRLNKERLAELSADVQGIADEIALLLAAKLGEVWKRREAIHKLTPQY